MINVTNQHEANPKTHRYYISSLREKALKDIGKSSLDPRKASEELLLKILKENKDTEYGKKYGFKDIHSIEEYRQKVPFSNYDTYEPYISRMVKQKEEPHHRI